MSSFVPAPHTTICGAVSPSLPRTRPLWAYTDSAFVSRYSLFSYVCVPCRCASPTSFVCMLHAQVMWLVVTEVQSANFGLVLHVQRIFANSFNILVTCGLPVTIFHSTCIFCVYGTALNLPTLRMRVCTICLLVCECYYNTITLWSVFFIVEYGTACFLSTVGVLKFRHHPHPPGYLLAKFCFFRSLHCWARPRRKIAYSINHSITHSACILNHSPRLVDAPLGNRSLRFGTCTALLRHW